ncbi:MAG TPA: PPOX class F420-dependent oxidoreductase [Solirubrobacteraceae bacterium]|jgi:PPOX class probable F420-dependent enzyme
MTTFPESHRDLLDAPVAALATLRADGFPQITEVWFLHDAGELRLSLNGSRHKTRNLRERPQCSLQILDLSNPDRYLEVRGLARLDEDPDYVFAARLAAKYGGLDLREIDGAGERRVAVTIEPVNVYPVDVGWVLAGEPPPSGH